MRKEMHCFGFQENFTGQLMSSPLPFQARANPDRKLIIVFIAICWCKCGVVTVTQCKMQQVAVKEADINKERKKEKKMALIKGPLNTLF